jgi:hypothetical protein
MPRKRRVPVTQASVAQSKRDERDQETIRLVNELLGKKNIVSLRKLAAIRGLVSNGLRSRVWPLLLGVDQQTQSGAGDIQEYETRSQIPHADLHVVECDIERSLWHLTVGWAEEDRLEKRAALKRILNATVAGNTGELHYYQGLHDVAAVLLFVCGEYAAYRLLSKLAKSHLRDCTRPTLEPAVEVLSMLYPILRVADPELVQYINSLKEPALEMPYFALSWHMTWFSHDVLSLEQCARLFDLFMSSHPLMPLYVAAVVIHKQREMILNCGPGAGDVVYSKLKNMKIFADIGNTFEADELAKEAAALYQKAPPKVLARLRRKNLQNSTTLKAFISDGRWEVPAPNLHKNSPKRDDRDVRLPKYLPDWKMNFRGLARTAPGAVYWYTGVAGILGVLCTTILAVQFHNKC